LERAAAIVNIARAARQLRAPTASPLETVPAPNILAFYGFADATAAPKALIAELRKYDRKFNPPSVATVAPRRTIVTPPTLTSPPAAVSTSVNTCVKGSGLACYCLTCDPVMVCGCRSVCFCSKDEEVDDAPTSPSYAVTQATHTSPSSPTFDPDKHASCCVPAMALDVPWVPVHSYYPTSSPTAPPLAVAAAQAATIPVTSSRPGPVRRGGRPKSKK
jgi:hypothetical protein